MDRVVVVQPTVYGTNNACMLEALRQLGSRARGVAMVDEAVPQGYLDEMDRRGVCGLRIGFETSGKTDSSIALRRFQTAIQQIADRKWHVQIGTRLPLIEALYNELSDAPVPIVFEHFAHAQAPLGLEQDGFKSLLNLVKSGRAYVKISAAYRCCSVSSRTSPDLPELAPFAKALLSANPQRVIWGSSWPHPEGTTAGHSAMDASGRMDIDDGQMLNLLATWAPDPELRKAVLVQNPARLYGF
jgi:predicted TIM-barrel fold metal-dependent hydrolase